MAAQADVEFSANRSYDPSGNGRPITPGDAEKPVSVSFRLDYNGWRGKTDVVTVSVQAETAEAAIFGSSGVICGVNFAGSAKEVEALAAKGGKAFDSYMKEYWAQNAFNGAIFTGWSTAPEGGVPMGYDSQVQEGAVYYAQWDTAPRPITPGDAEKPTPTSTPRPITPGDAEKPTPTPTPKPTPTPEPPQPKLEFIGVTYNGALRSHINGSKSVSVQLKNTSAKATYAWKADVYLVRDDIPIEDVLKRTYMKSLTLSDGETTATQEEYGVTIRSSDGGKTLTVTSGSQEVAVVITAIARMEDGKTCQTSVNAQIFFTHSWTRTGGEAPTCTEDGYSTYECGYSGCHETKTVTEKAPGHAFNKIEIISDSVTDTSSAQWSKTCGICGITVHEDAVSGADLLVEDGGVIHGRTVKEVKEMFGNEMIPGGINVNIRKADGSWLSYDNAYITTGCTIIVKSGYETTAHYFPVILPGDTNGDGYVNEADAQAIAEALCFGGLSGDFMTAAQLEETGAVTVGDVVTLLDMLDK